MKTQAELREIAAKNAMRIDGLPLGVREVLADYLRLTDPTKLTAEHCRAAGMMFDLFRRQFFCRGFDELSLSIPHGSETCSRIHVPHPTTGLLYAAQRQEESR